MSQPSMGSVECCNGDVYLTKTCVNHKYVSYNEQTCSALNPCKLSGTYQIDPSDISRKTVITEGCVEGKCVRTSKQVECASSVACPEGQSCVDFECKLTGGAIGGGLINQTSKNCDAIWSYSKLIGTMHRKYVTFLFILRINGSYYIPIRSYTMLDKHTPIKNKGINALISFVITAFSVIIAYYTWWIILLVALLLIVLFIILKVIL